MNKKIYIIIVLIAAMGCKQAYNPKIVGTTTNYLVVEGTINTGTDSTIIQLSRTVPLTSTAKSKPELGAAVAIISNTGASYLLAEAGKGFYKGPGLNLAGTSNTFGLKITTADGRVYQSDLVVAKNSPPLDSVYYRPKNDGIEIYADTHDPANNTRYYRWDFVDTYEFHSAYQSYDYFTSVPFDTVYNRTAAQLVFTCWRSDTSTNILLNSSAKLSQDVIANNPIYFIPLSSEQLEDRYSILVKQYALVPDAFNYFTQLKKNTEQLGSIFDAQPSELPGNIHCVTNPAEPVLGYVTAGSSAQTRIFIDTFNLPAHLTTDPYNSCVIDTDLFDRVIHNVDHNQVAEYIYSGQLAPVVTIEPPGSNKILGYTAASYPCVDCTLRGTNVQPSFWVNP